MASITSSLHKKCNPIPMAVTQRLISGMMRRSVGARGGLTEVIPDTETQCDIEARPLCNLTRCTALLKSVIPMKIRHDC